MNLISPEMTERIGLLVDKLSNIDAAMGMPFPDNLHMKALRDAIPEVLGELTAIHMELVGC